MTKLKFTPIIALAVLMIAATLTTLAQGKPGSRRYDPATEITVKGSVENVTELTGRRGWKGTHLILKTDAETLAVHVGPSAFLSQNQFSVAKGDQVEVTGSKVTRATGTVLIAREIKKDGKTLVLRDASGVPQWARGAAR